MLMSEELQRYARQMAMPEFGEAGQKRLRSARVLLIGAGGLGSPAAVYLAAAGVGTLGVIDPDAVELSNLHRQILHGAASVGRAKVESAVETLRGINPHVQLVAMRERFTAEKAIDLVRGWDVVVDGTDNFPTRYASNDACVALGVPNVYGSVWRFEGQVSVWAPHLGGPCYRCLNPQAPAPGEVPGCAEAGVLGVVPGLVGTLQALEAIKLITGLGEPLVGRLLHVDAARMKFREFQLRQDPHCARCAEGRRDLPVEPEGMICAESCAMTTDEISVVELAALRGAGDPHVLLDVREAWELATAKVDGFCHIPLGEIPARYGEVPRDVPVFVMCHGGVRSGRVVEFLRESGFANVRNVRGGIAAWSAEVDPSVPTY